LGNRSQLIQLGRRRCKDRLFRYHRTTSFELRTGFR
jgi:hypothetical protein